MRCLYAKTLLEVLLIDYVLYLSLIINYECIVKVLSLQIQQVIPFVFKDILFLELNYFIGELIHHGEDHLLAVHNFCCFALELVKYLEEP